jgi:hypothetical protein
MTKYWRGQQAVLELTGGSLSSDPIGVLQEVTIAPDVERQELRGAGNTSFLDVAETARAFDISGEVLAWKIEAWDRMVEYDDVNGGTDTSADVQEFTVTVTFEAADDSTKEIPFPNAYFNPPPEVGADRESWVGLQLELRAPDIGTITNTDASA